jgi:hypothetical protein
MLGHSTIKENYKNTYIFLLQAEHSRNEILALNSIHVQDMLKPWETLPEREIEIPHDQVCLNIHMVFISQLQIKEHQNLCEDSVSK